MRRARLLAFFLDWTLCAGLADVAGLALTWMLWKLLPGWRAAVPYVWTAVGVAALLAFLLRDSSGGRARRWLALEAVDGEGRPPGIWGSVRRNLPLLIPVWNLVEVWPILRHGEAGRPADRRRGIRIVSTT
jgi:hypothetical protein